MSLEILASHTDNSCHLDPVLFSAKALKPLSEVLNCPARPWGLCGGGNSPRRVPILASFLMNRNLDFLPGHPRAALAPLPFTFPQHFAFPSLQGDQLCRLVPLALTHLFPASSHSFLSPANFLPQLLTKSAGVKTICIV